MSTKRKRLYIYADERFEKRLELAATHPKVSKSEIARRAIELYLSEEQEAMRNNPILRRLDQMTRESERLRQRLIVLTESHALFVRYFLTLVPAPRASERRAARAEGAVRFEGYREALETILSDKTRHLFDGIEDVFLGKSDFFSEDELAAMEVAPPARLVPATSDEGGSDD